MLADGIRKTEERLSDFESKYQFSTSDFLSKFSNDELHHSPEFDEWIGEYPMLKRLQANAQELKAVKILTSRDFRMAQGSPVNQLVN